MGHDIELTAADGGRFAAYLSMPASTLASISAPSLIVLPEVFNTNAHIRAVANQYAAEGFIVIAPDVYWRQAPGSYQEYTDEGFKHSVTLREQLDADQLAADIGDIVKALRARQDYTGQIGVMGFASADASLF
jgi:carboxymethylenebutenolidase